MSAIIESYGLFWRVEDVFWGSGSSKGSLLGKLSVAKLSDPVDFRDQVGIYVLYDNERMVYVGQTGSGNLRLLRRLRKHRSDHLAGRWDRFSWFGLRRVLKKGNLAMVSQKARASLPIALNHIEAVLIAASEPVLNRQGGQFGKKRRYLQVRDERLGLTQAEMIESLFESRPIE